MFYGIVITTCFQSRLISIMSFPVPTKQILTYSDLQYSGLDIYVSERISLLIRESTINKMFNPIIRDDLVSNLDFLRLIIKDPSFAVITSGYVYHVYRNDTINDRGYEIVHRLQENIFEYSILSIMPKGHPMYKKMNSAILILHSHGLFKALKSFGVNYTRPLKPGGKSTRRALGMDQLLLSFIILIGGLSLALVGFWVEIFDYMRVKKKRRGKFHKFGTSEKIK